MFEPISTTDPVVTVHPNDEGTVTIPESMPLFEASFSRNGQDLVIEHAGHAKVFVPGYFLTTHAADLTGPNGSILRGDLVELLAGPLAPAQYAQVGAAQGGSPIGQVELLEGGASVQRVDGTVEELQVGMKIFQQDVVQTEDGASLSVTFVDGTIFTLASASRMVIDELIYDPESSNNSGGFSLLQGSFVFIAGQVAKTGGMDVSTPSSTMGIRGTTVIVEVASDNGVVISEITLANDPDGDTGVVELYDLAGNLIANITETNTKWILSASGDFSRELERSPQDSLEDSILIAEAFAAFRAATLRVDAGDTFVTLTDPIPNNSAQDSVDDAGTDLEVDNIDEPEGILPQEQAPEQLETEEFQQFDDTLLPQDDDPVALDIIRLAVSEDASLTGDLTADIDEFNVISFSLSNGPKNGAATVNSDGTFSFVPTPDFNGTDTFTFVALTTDELEIEGSVIVDILPVNDAPTTTDITATLQEDEISSNAVLALDVDGDDLSFTIQDTPSNGEVVLLSNGKFTYTPKENFEGPDSFTVLVSDPDGATALSTVTLLVEGSNDAPQVTTTVAEASRAIVENDVASVGGTLAAEDFDQNDQLTWSGNADGVFGTFSISEDGVWNYVVDPNAIETLNVDQTVVETFVATVTDEANASDTIEVTIELTGTNDLPVLTSDVSQLSGAVTEDGVSTIATGTLTAVDSDTDATVVFATTATALYGTFDITPQGVWTYTLDPSLSDELFEGQEVVETLEVTVSDGVGPPVSQFVIVTITGSNDLPVLTSDVSQLSGAVTEDGVSTIATGTLTAEDADTDATVVFATTATALYGTFNITPQGVWTYTLDPSLSDELFEGQEVVETLEVTVSDGIGSPVSQFVTVTITGSNDAPSVSSEPSDSQGSVTEGNELNVASGTLAATDPDSGDAITWAGVSTAVYGIFVISETGVWSYTLDNSLADTLAQGETVTETLVATATDSFGAQTTEIVEVTVTGTNDRPVVSIITDFNTVEDTAISGVLTAFDIDSSPASLTFEPGGLTPQNGVLELNTDGTFTYTPNEGFVGLERFSYTVTDEFGAQSSGRVTIGVESDADKPENENVSISLNVDATEDTAAAAVEIKITATEPTPVNLAIALDRSGSIGFWDWRTLLESTQEAVETLAAQFDGSETQVDVKIITFAADVNVSPTYTLGDPALIDYFDASVFDYVGGSTSWTLAFEEAGNFFFSEDESETNFLIFVTDGVPSDSLYTVPLADLTDPNDNYDITISAFGFGEDFVDGSLDPVDPGAGQFNDPAELVAALETTPIFNPELTSLTVTLEADGGDPIVIADELSPFLILEGTDFELPLASIENILDLLGESNRISIDAQFDLNGDPLTSEIVLFSSDVIGKSDVAQTKSGFNADDLIFGSDLADALGGAGGNDILIGFDGEDTLDGGAGNDTLRAGDGNDRLLVTDTNTLGDDIDGGAGRDVLALAAIGDINAMLSDLTLNDIEALDMSNNGLDNLQLSYADVLSISDNLDPELSEFSEVAGDQTMSIYGDSADRLTLDGSNQYQIVQTGSGKDSNDVDLTFFQFQDSFGNALATLGVQSDVAVETANVPVV